MPKLEQLKSTDTLQYFFDILILPQSPDIGPPHSLPLILLDSGDEHLQREASDGDEGGGGGPVRVLLRRPGLSGERKKLSLSSFSLFTGPCRGSQFVHKKLLGSDGEKMNKMK